ncbi:MAG: hypothetical protein ACOCRO_01465 [Halanaerobiales bacterium]
MYHQLSNDFRKYVIPYENSFTTVKVPECKIKRIHNLANNIAKLKLQEKKVDTKNLSNRFYTGLLGEAAIEEITGLNVIEWTVGHSTKYDKPDLHNAGYNVGVKTVNYGLFPVVHKRPMWPEIINFIKNDKEVMVCGIAPLDSLILKQNDSYILSDFLRRKGNKTAFYGFSDILSFSNYKEFNKAYYTEIFFQKISTLKVS